jgi:hypothetical protein
MYEIALWTYADNNDDALNNQNVRTWYTNTNMRHTIDINRENVRYNGILWNRIEYMTY